MTENNNINKCRTCFKGSKGLQHLSKLITEEKEETKSFADFLKDITHIDIMNVNYGDMPQSICVYCVRKLKSSYAFVQQAQEVHNKLWSILCAENGNTNCLKEEEIDIENCMEIKLEEEDSSGKGTEELAAFKTDDPQHGNASTSSIPDKSKNDVSQIGNELNFDLNDGIEPTTVIKQSDESEYEDDSDADYSKPEGFSDSEVESQSSTDSDWAKPKVRTKKTRAKHIVDNIPTSCDKCDRVFPNSHLLKRHTTRTHIPEELKVQCPFCPAKYARRHHMYVHMRTNHKDKPIEEHMTKQHRTLPRQYACEHCDGNYTSNYYLRAHMKLKHSSESAPNNTERVLLPKKRFLCALCGSKFDTPSSLNVHIRRHTGDKPFKCNLCDRCFYKSCDLRVHHRSHTGEKPYFCKICEKPFAKSNKLKIHMRAHSNERPYKCDQCEKAYKDSKNLKIHKRLHTGERPYICAVCHMGFIKATSLKYHQTKTQHFEAPNQEVQQSANMQYFEAPNEEVS